MGRLTLRLTLAALVLLAFSAWTFFSAGFHAARLVAAADDPVRLTDLALEGRLTTEVATSEIESALAGDDPELAASFVALADAQRISVPAELRRRVATANAPAAATLRAAGRFVDGFVIGDPEDVAGLAGTIAGDLVAYGDVRDIVRESVNWARGEDADELILGLACVGLAITAGTYATLGAASPARVGVSLIKAASKAGRLSAKFIDSVVRPLRGAVDMGAVRSALGPRALLHPAVAVRGVRSAVKIEKASGVTRVVADVGRINAKAGTRAALDGLKLADGPKDVAKLARLAEAKGGQTRAILKLLGRGAIALSMGMFHLASGIFWALLNALFLVVGLKRTVERMAERAIRRDKRRRARRLASAAVPG